MASAMKLRDTDPAERVLDYLTTLAREQDVHVVTLDAIIGACDIRPLKWPELLNKLADKVEAAPGRDAYRLRKKRDLMARLTDEERVVGHLLKGPASPAEIRQALKAILQSLAVTVEAIPEEQPQGSAALRKAVADHVGMSELASDGDLLEGLETMRAIGAAEHMAVQETRAALAAARAERADRTILRWMPVAYIEAALDGVGQPDALRVAEGFMNARRAAGAAWMRFAARTGGVKSTHRRSPAHADDEATANAGVDPITPRPGCRCRRRSWWSEDA